MYFFHPAKEKIDFDRRHTSRLLAHILTIVTHSSGVRVYLLGVSGLNKCYTQLNLVYGIYLALVVYYKIFQKWNKKEKSVFSTNSAKNLHIPMTNTPSTILSTVEATMKFWKSLLPNWV